MDDRLAVGDPAALGFPRSSASVACSSIFPVCTARSSSRAVFVKRLEDHLTPPKVLATTFLLGQVVGVHKDWRQGT